MRKLVIVFGATAAFVGIVVAGTVAANAQTASFSNKVGVDSGDLKVGHASGATVGVQDGKVVAGGGVADGVKIGSTSATSAIQGAVTAPVQVLKGMGFKF